MGNFGVVYARTSKILRRIVVPDTEPADWQQFVGNGEANVLLPLAGPRDMGTIRSAVSQANGNAPIPSGVCAVISAGTVVGNIMADPALDALPGFTLVSSDTAIPGDTWDGSFFFRVFATMVIATRTVTAIGPQRIDHLNPPNGSTFMPPGGLKVGDVVPSPAAPAIA